MTSSKPFSIRFSEKIEKAIRSRIKIESSQTCRELEAELAIASRPQRMAT